MADLGHFAEGFATWRKVLASVPKIEDRWNVFANTAKEIASYVSNGLDRASAADELNLVAEAYGLIEHRGIDDVQAVISGAFLHAEANAERVPDDIDIGQANGKTHSLPSATPYVFPDPALIPPRAWLYAGHYVRQTATATVAPGGFGKTTLTLFELVFMAGEGLRVWYISGEDPRDEIDRRIAAHCQHHETDCEKVAQCLFVDDKVSFPFIIGKSVRTASVIFDHGWLKFFQDEIVAKKIDVVALDPFISFHSVPEGDNGAIDQIVKRLALIAQNTASCIELSHHVRKPMQGLQADLTVDDTRGGSAIVNAVRSCRVINRMNSNEAALARVGEDKRAAYIRIDKGKRNMAPAEKAQWWHIVSVHLPNGDNVQAIERWEYPSAFAGMTEAEVIWVSKFLREAGPRRASSGSEDWLGHDIGRHVGRDDTHTKEGAMWANKVIGEWIRNKVIKKVPLRDPVSRKPNIAFYVHYAFVEMGEEHEATILPFKRKGDEPQEPDAPNGEDEPNGDDSA
jgi:hypothetical protein